ncbi:MAG: CBS domain-containing protein [Firmicutes bacterium]|nr:CBS domain-containing protein [Bacillota bacterium]
MVTKGGLYVSEILDRSVLVPGFKTLGRVTDVLVELGDTFPRVTSVEITAGRRKTPVLVPWGQLELSSLDSLKIHLNTNEVATSKASDQEIYLRKDLLDKQIVDTHGAKVVRVNDLLLENVHGAVRLIAVDIGTRGLFRRLGFERAVDGLGRALGFRISDQLVSWELVDPLATDLSRVKLSVPHQKLAKLHPAEIADIVSDLDTRERRAVFQSLDDETAADALSEVDPRLQALILEDLGSERASDILEEMAPDDAADALGELPEEKAEELLNLMEKEDAEEVRELLDYDENTAGGLMNTEFIAFPAQLTTDETIRELRRQQPSAESIYYVYVVDKMSRLCGVVALRDLIVAPSDTSLSRIMITKVVSVPVDMGKQQIANVITKYDLLAIPVVDEKGVLQGIVSIYDVVDSVLTPKWLKKLQSKD